MEEGNNPPTDVPLEGQKKISWENRRNKEIESTLKREQKLLHSELKLLLLGAGESGKSTIAKQMKILHLDGFPEEDRNKFKPLIFSNVISAVQVLIEASKSLEINLLATNTDAASRILVAEVRITLASFTPQIVQDLRLLLDDPGIKKTYNQSSQFQFNDSAVYYFTEMDRLSDPEYVPSVADILRSRQQTTGVQETKFVVDNFSFRLIDVGGQRSQRRKWIHCFENVTAVLFVVAMSEYDLKLSEDESVNRMHESLQLFDDICNNGWLQNVSMILFLNKKDLFQEKIQKVDLNYCFPEYTGGKDYENASNYIKSAFNGVNKNKKKRVYIHFTCATDTQNIQIVFSAVKDIILRTNLDMSGLAT